MHFARPGWVESFKIASSEYTARCRVIPIHIMFTASLSLRGRVKGEFDQLRDYAEWLDMVDCG